MKYLLSTLLIAICLFNSNCKTCNTCKYGGLDSVAKVFLPIAGSRCIMEIEMGKLATTVTKSKDVRGFADTMIKEHSDALREYHELMDRYCQKYPLKMLPFEQKLYDSLKMKPADSFDKAYIGRMVSDHLDAINQFGLAYTYATDSFYKAWLMKMKMVVTMHYEMAKKLPQ